MPLGAHVELPRHLRQSRLVKTTVLATADQRAEQFGVAQQVHVADVLLADVDSRRRSFNLAVPFQCRCRLPPRQIARAYSGARQPPRLTTMQA